MPGSAPPAPPRSRRPPRRGERRLLVGQGRELLTGLRVRECYRDEPRKLPDPLLGVRRKPQVAGERHDDGAPDVPRDDDRRGDEGGHTKREQPSVELGGNAGVVRGQASRRSRPRDLGSALPSSIATIVPAPGIWTPGSLHLPTMTPVPGVRPQADEVRGVCAEEATHLLGHDVEDPLRCRLGRNGHRNAVQGRLFRDERAEVDLVPRHAESSHAPRRTATSVTRRTQVETPGPNTSPETRPRQSQVTVCYLAARSAAGVGRPSNSLY